jgi:cytochrome c-type biogenesis protein CcmH/NrfG
VFELQLAGIELGQVEDIVEQLHQHLARVMGDGQLLLLLGIQRAVEGQGDHAQQAVEGVRIS